MTVRETSSHSNIDMQLQAALAMIAEVATEETNEHLAKKSEQKTEKRRSGNKMLSLHAPKLTAKKIHPSDVPAPAPKPIPTVVPGITVLTTTTSQNNQEELKEKAVAQLWNTLQQRVEDFNRLQAETAKNSTEPVAPPPAPKFTPAEQRAAVNMASYMLAILTASIDLASDQNKVSGQTNDLSNAMVTLNKQEAQKAVDDLNNVLQQEYDLAHESFWEKLKHAFTAIGHIFLIVNPITCVALLIQGGPDAIKKQWHDFNSDLALSGPVFQEVVAGLMILGGAASGNVGLVMMGTMMLAMSASGGQNDLNNWIATHCDNNTGLKILLDVAISILMAVALCGIAGGLTAFFCDTSSAGSSALTTTSEEAAGNGVAGAGSAANAVAAPAEEVISNENSMLDTFQAFLKKAAERGFGSSVEMASKNLVVKSIMTAGLTSLWNDVVKGIIEGINATGGRQTGEAKIDEVSAIAGALIGAVAVFGSASMETETNDVIGSLTKKLEASLGEHAFLLAKRSFQFFSSMMALLAAGQAIQAGVNELHQANVLNDMGTAMAAQSIYGGLIDMIDSIISSNTTTGNEIHSDFAAINSRWDSIFVTPWNA